MVSLGVYGEDSNWFGNNISCKLGKGNDIDLWRHEWLGDNHFKLQFPVLLNLVQNLRQIVGGSGQ